MSVVGVDFGSANSVIAAAGRGGVDVILNGNSNRLNPSMVGFDQCRKMGEEAQTGASSNYKNTIKQMKRLIGLPFDDPKAQAEIQKWIPFTCVPIKHPTGGPDSIGVKVTLNGEESVVSMEAMAGMMMKHMGMIAAKKAAETSDGVEEVSKLFPQDWVIAIPAYFTDAQRRGLLVGCEIAGFQVQRLIHENTATALAYGIFKDLKKEFTKDKPTNVMFIDMGASAYTVSIAAFEPGKLIVKSSHFDADLGGREFDLVVAQWIAKQFQEKYKGRLSGNPMEKPKVRLKLMTAAEKAKKTLSPQGVKESRINLECLMDDFDFSCSLRADEYEAMCAPLLARLAEPVKKALQETGLTSAELASVEIVGGSTRIGCVKRELIKLLAGKNLATTMNADEAVARGAALQSAILSPRFKVLPYEIQESQPFPIKISWDEQLGETGQQGVEVDGQAQVTETPANSVVMFDRGLNFPIVRRVTLRRSGNFNVTSAYDNSALDYGLPPDATRDIASFQIKLKTEGEKKVRVNVKQDIHGVVHLSSAQMVEEVEGEEESIEVEMKDGQEEQKQEKKKKIKKTNLEFSQSRPLDWSRDEINKAFEAEVAMANIDRVVKETSDMRNELESYIYGMRAKITSSSHLADYATDEEKAAFTTKQETIENWLYEDGFDATKSVYAEKLAELKRLGGPIEMRFSEAQARPAALSALQSNLEKFKQWLNESQSDEKFAHISDVERNTCHSKCDEISAWMYDMMDKQGSKPLSADPVYKVADIEFKHRELTNVCSPVKHKPMPKKEEPKPAAAAAAAAEPEGKTAEGKDESEPMEGVEAENGNKPDAPAETTEKMEE